MANDNFPIAIAKCCVMKSQVRPVIVLEMSCLEK